MATLKALEEQLSLALTAAQRHLEASVDRSTSTALPTDDTEQLRAVSIEIERLQTELQTATATILAQTKLALASVPAVTSPVQRAQVSTQDDSETETEDEDLDVGSQDVTKKRPRQAAGDDQELPDQKKTKQSPPSLEISKAKLLRFVQATDETCKALQAGPTKTMILVAPFGLCRAVSIHILQLLDNGQVIDEETAKLYRDTTGKLAAIAMNEQTAGKIPAKILDLIISRLGKILELADKGTGIPAALSDPVLRSTRLTLKKYADDHSDDMLLSIHKYVQSIPNPGKNLFSHLGKLLADFGKELASFLRYQDIGMVRQEEQWKIFDEITMTLAIWISHLPKSAKQPKELSSTFRMMKIFNARFPDRIPQALLKIARNRNFVSLKQQKAEKKEKSS